MVANFVIVVQGAPGVGKTSLVGKLTKEFDVGVIAKDDIKELLFEKLGSPADSAESKLYGRAVIKALFVIANDIAEGGKSFILECAFMPELADTDFAFIKKTGINLVQLYCHTSPEIRRERFYARVNDGSRHAGHPDTKVLPLSDFIEKDKLYGPLHIKQTIDVDMTDFDDSEYSKLILRIKQLLTS